MKVLHESRLSGHEGRVWSVDWKPDGKVLASCGEDKSIRLWQKLDSEEWVCTNNIMTPHKRSLRRVKWSPLGDLLAVCSFDGTVSLWRKSDNEDSTEVSDGHELVAQLEGHENEVKDVAWSCDSTWLATCSRDKSVWIWKTSEDADDMECSSVMTSHSQDVKSLTWHPHLPLLYSTSYDTTIHSYQADDDEEWCTSSQLVAGTSTIWCMSFNRDATNAVTCCDDGVVCVWRCCEAGILTTWQVLATFNHLRPVYHVHWDIHTDLIASGANDNLIRIYRHTQENTEQIHQLKHTNDINAVCWNPNNKNNNNNNNNNNDNNSNSEENKLLLATCSDDGLVMMFTLDCDII